MDFLSLLPLPKIENGRFGWLKQYLLDWLLPNVLGFYSAYTLTSYFLSDVPEAERAWVLSVNTVLSNSTNLISSSWFSIAVYIVCAIGLISFLLQHFEFAPIKIRKTSTLNPLAYWVFFLITKILGMLIIPLAVAYSFASLDAKCSFGWWLCTPRSESQQSIAILTLGLIIVAFFIYLLMLFESQPKFIVLLEVKDQDPNKKNKFLVQRIGDLEDNLKQSAKEIGSAAGGIWSLQIIVDNEAENGYMTVGLRRSGKDWNKETRDSFSRVISGQQSKWTKELNFSIKLSHFDRPKIRGKKNRRRN